MDGDRFGQLLYLGLILAALIGWGMAEFRGRMGQGLRMALAWGAIFVAVMAGYGLWHDIRRDVILTQSAEADRVEVPRSNDGHYYMTLTLQGTEIRFMADTGATNVVLSPADARRLGLDPATLVFAGQSQTANGTVRTAYIRLQDVTLGPFHDDEIGAAVNESEMSESLLGMDYLGLFHIEIAADRMILRR